MPRERSLEERVAMVNMYNQLGSARAVVSAWPDAFPTPPPHHQTVLRNVEKFDGNVTAAAYRDLLVDFAGPHLIDNLLYLQQDGAPPHFGNIVRDWLNINLPHRWIGRGGQFDLNFPWPPRSPDLTVCDFFLWGYIKEQVYARGSPATLDELRESIQEECDNVPLEMCARACRSVPSRYEDCIAYDWKALPY